MAISSIAAALLVACGDSNSGVSSENETFTYRSEAPLANSSSIDNDVKSSSSSDKVVPDSESSSSEAVSQKIQSSSSMDETTKNNDKVAPDSESSSSEAVEDNSNSSAQGSSCNGVTYNPLTHFCAKREETEERAYKFVIIAPTGTDYSETWMAENLDYKMTDSWCYAETEDEPKTENCHTYGRLYTWTAAKSACPDGWHLPSIYEWQALINAVNTSTTSPNDAGYHLKSSNLWISNAGKENADTYGFSALPAGRRYNIDKLYNFEKKLAYFWSATDGKDNYEGSYIFMITNQDYVTFMNSDIKLLNADDDEDEPQGSVSNSYSVRCVKDSE